MDGVGVKSAEAKETRLRYSYGESSVRRCCSGSDHVRSSAEKVHNSESRDAACTKEMHNRVMLGRSRR